MADELATLRYCAVKELADSTGEELATVRERSWLQYGIQELATVRRGAGYGTGEITGYGIGRVS